MKRISLKDLILSPEELKNITELLAQKRGIKDCENMCHDKLLGALKASEYKNKTKIDEIREEIKKLQLKFSRQELKEIKKNLYKIENKNSLSASKKTETYLTKLEETIYKLNRYYDYDDAEYRGIRDVKDLFDLSIGEDYYKPILVNSFFSNNYIQYESKGDKILTIEEYLNMIETHLVDMINDYKNQSEWKIQLTATINFISSKPDPDETHIMHTKSNNIEIMIGSDTNDVIKELFKSLLQRYQENLETKMKGSEFVFNGVNMLYYDLNKIGLNR